MMKKITVSAPGKLMLFGEHAVVYNRPCLVTAVDQRMRATIEILDSPDFFLDAPDVNITGYKKSMQELGKGEIPKGAKFVEIAVRNFAAEYKLAIGLKVTTKSEFSSQFGFGSSSASTVCVLNALAELTGKKLSDKQIFDLAYQTVLDIQGKGSGFDVAAAVFGGTLHFITGGKVINPLHLNELPLIVGYSGIKADTVTLMNQVSEKAKKYPKVVNNIYTDIELLVGLAKKEMTQHNWQLVGELMNINQGFLESLGVSSGKLSAMIYAARDAGAYGAKLSGAGGGDCMIALAPDGKKKDVEKAIEAVGGEVIHVQTNAEGVRVESFDKV